MSIRSYRSTALFCVLAIAWLALPAQAQDPIVSAVERVPAQTVIPKYPPDARRDRIEGEVEVCFNVDRKGRPKRIAVRSSTHRIFEKPAIRAVRASRYVPLKRSEPVPTIKTCRTFTFSLEKDVSGR